MAAESTREAGVSTEIRPDNHSSEGDVVQDVPEQAHKDGDYCVQLPSGEAVFQSGRECRPFAATIVGQKRLSTSGTELEAKQVETLLRERATVLSHHRVHKPADIAHGTWHPQEDWIVLDKPRGHFFSFMGRVVSNKMVLSPMEALFLVESNQLSLSWNSVPMSLSEAYNVLLTSKEELDKFQVYAHLLRAGYIVVPHRAKGCTELDQSQKCAEQESDSDSDVVCLDSDDSDVVQVVTLSKEQPSHGARKQSSPTKLTVANSPKRTRQQASQGSTDDVLSFPTLAAGRPVVLKRPPEHLLPKNVAPSREWYTLQLPFCPLGWEDAPAAPWPGPRGRRNSGHRPPARAHYVPRWRGNSDHGGRPQPPDFRDWRAPPGLCEGRVPPSQRDERGPPDPFDGRRPGLPNQHNIHSPPGHHDTRGLQAHWDVGSSPGLHNIRGAPSHHSESSQPSHYDRRCPPTNHDVRHPPFHRNWDRRHYRWGERGHRQDRRGTHDHPEQVGESVPLYECSPGLLARCDGASSWSQLKVGLTRGQRSSALLKGPGAVLWKGPVKPLVLPSRDLSLAGIVSQLALLEEVDLIRKKPPNGNIDQPGADLDVYLPGGNFTKNNPGLPEYRVALLRWDHGPPTLQDVVHRQRASGDGVPLVFATLDRGQVHLHAMETIVAPRFSASGP